MQAPRKAKGASIAAWHVDQATGAIDHRAAAARIVGSVFSAICPCHRISRPTRQYLNSTTEQCLYPADRRTYNVNRAARGQRKNGP